MKNKKDCFRDGVNEKFFVYSTDGTLARSRRWRASEAEGSKPVAVAGCAVVWASGVAQKETLRAKRGLVRA